MKNTLRKYKQELVEKLSHLKVRFGESYVAQYPEEEKDWDIIWYIVHFIIIILYFAGSETYGSMLLFTNFSG